MNFPDRNGSLVEATRISALRQNINDLQGNRITPERVSSLYRSSRALATDVMGLNPLAASLFAMRFGTVILTSATTKEIAHIEHVDGSVTEVPLNNPAEIGRSVARYLHDHFNPHSGRRGKGKLIFDLHDRVSRAGITTDILDKIQSAAEEVAIDISRDPANLSVRYFATTAKCFDVQPYYSMLQGDDYTAFMAETGVWLEGEVSNILDNVLTGKYLNEQEMQQ